MSITIAFPLGYKPVLKHGEHDQSDHGSWATGDLVENGTISKDSKLDKELSSLVDSGYNYEEQFMKDIKKQDLALSKIYEVKGFDGKPVSVESWDEFDSMESPVIEGGMFDGRKLFGDVGGGYDYENGRRGEVGNPITEFSRGFQDGTDAEGNPVKAEDAVESFVNGDKHWAGKGVAGNGTYVAMNPPTAAGYTNNDDLNGAISFKLDSSAKVGSYTKISSEMLKLKEEGKLPKSLEDVGRFAAAKGYDAYIHDTTDSIDRRTVPDMAIILNRSKVVFRPSKNAGDVVNYRFGKAGK